MILPQAWCFWEAGFYYELIEYYRRKDADGSMVQWPGKGEIVLDLDATEGRQAPLPSWLVEVADVADAKVVAAAVDGDGGAAPAGLNKVSKRSHDLKYSAKLKRHCTIGALASGATPSPQ